MKGWIGSIKAEAVALASIVGVGGCASTATTASGDGVYAMVLNADRRVPPRGFYYYEPHFTWTRASQVEGP